MRSGPELERVSHVALALRDGRIAGIASEAEAAALVPGARAFELAGALVLPGLVDTHTHLGWAGEGMWRVVWADVADRDAALERVRVVAGRIDPGFWITGGGWDRAHFRDAEVPSCRELDLITGDAPLYLVSEDHAAAVANSRALVLFKIDRETVDPPGSGIERDATGAPTGRLFGRVVRSRMTAEVVPPPDRYRRRAELRAALRELSRHGVTEAHDIATYPDAGPTPMTFRERGFTDATLFDDLAERGELAVRIGVRPYLGRWAEAAAWSRAERPLIRCHGVKMIIDDGRWSEGPEAGRYEFRYPGFEQTLAWMREADRAGLDVTLHGLGDLAVTEALDLFEAIATTEPPRPRRPRLAHARRVSRPDIERIARLGVLVEAQPWEVLEQLPLMTRRFSAEFVATAYPFAQFVAAGVRLAFGSDWRITPQRPDLADMDPLRAIAAATTRGLTVPQAIACYTEQAAWAGRVEDRRGVVRAGSDADLAVLSRDIVGDPEALPDTRVLLTIVGGRVSYDVLGSR